MLACAHLGGVSLQAGSQAPHHSSLEVFDCSPVLPPWCSYEGASCTFQILLLAFLLGEEGVQVPEQQIHLQRKSHGCPSSPAQDSWLPVGQLAAAVGENSGSAPAQITITSHVHILHNLVETKLLKFGLNRIRFSSECFGRKVL